MFCFKRILSHKGTFYVSFYHFSFFSHSIDMLCEAPCLLAQPLKCESVVKFVKRMLTGYRLVDCSL